MGRINWLTIGCKMSQEAKVDLMQVRLNMTQALEDAKFNVEPSDTKLQASTIHGVRLRPDHTNQFVTCVQKTVDHYYPDQVVRLRIDEISQVNGQDMVDIDISIIET
jgi:hypothetical protein